VKRREFITLFGGAAAWPLAARAQQGEQMRRIGVLINLTADDPEGRARLAAFLEGLRELGGGLPGISVERSLLYSASRPRIPTSC
jgi:putative ABC transport system substrate-binding protein